MSLTETASSTWFSQQTEMKEKDSCVLVGKFIEHENKRQVDMEKLMHMKICFAEARAHSRIK